MLQKQLLLHSTSKLLLGSISNEQLLYEIAAVHLPFQGFQNRRVTVSQSSVS